MCIFSMIRVFLSLERNQCAAGPLTMGIRQYKSNFFPSLGLNSMGA
jgi:hypothetical protein